MERRSKPDDRVCRVYARSPDIRARRKRLLGSCRYFIDNALTLPSEPCQSDDATPLLSARRCRPRLRGAAARHARLPAPRSPLPRPRARGDVIDVVPGMNNLTIVFDALATTAESLTPALRDAWGDGRRRARGRPRGRDPGRIRRRRRPRSAGRRRAYRPVGRQSSRATRPAPTSCSSSASSRASRISAGPTPLLHAAPRARLEVPAGSSASAARRRASTRPRRGGWQLIGRTSHVLFDRRGRNRRCCCPATAYASPLPESTHDDPEHRTGHHRSGAGRTAVHRAGSRAPRARHLGVAQGGALDGLALEVGNRLVGNRPDAAAVEITIGPAAFRFTRARPALRSPAPSSVRRSTASAYIHGGACRSRPGRHFSARREARDARLPVHRRRHRRAADARLAQHRSRVALRRPRRPRAA